MINGSWFSGNRSPSRKYTTTPLLAKTPLFYSPAPLPRAPPIVRSPALAQPAVRPRTAPPELSRTLLLILVTQLAEARRGAARDTTHRRPQREVAESAMTSAGVSDHDAPCRSPSRRRANVRGARGPLGRTGGSVRYRASENLPVAAVQGVVEAPVGDTRGDLTAMSGYRVLERTARRPRWRPPSAECGDRRRPI